MRANRTSTCILFALVHGSPRTVGAVFVRHLGDREYRRVIDDEEATLSCSSCVVSDSGSLFVLVERLFDHEGQVGGTSDSIVRMDLVERGTEVWKCGEQVSTEVGWVSELTGTHEQPTGVELFAVGAVPHSQDREGFSVAYEMVSIDWVSKQVERLGTLPGMFF